MTSLQAGVLAPGSDSTAITAVSALDLALPGQTLLYAAHSVSTWVLTIDSNLGVDYFDAASRHDRPGYLLDFKPEFVATGGRQVLLTTRASDEVTRLVAPLTEQLDVDPAGSGPLLLLEALRSLSGRLAMRLMSAPSQVQGALGMALSRLFLEAHALLEDAIVIPLDAHPELAVPTEEGASALRGDLLVVSANPAERLVEFMVIESKCHRGTGLGADLRNRITEQVTASADRLIELFQADDSNDRVDRSLRSWQLTTVLAFYLNRARRYGLIKPSAANELRHFISDLDSGYRLSVRRSGLVFRLDEKTSWLDDSNPDVPIWIVGRDSIARLLTEAIRNFVAAPDARAQETTGEPADNPLITETRDREPTWEDVRRTFGGTRSPRTRDNAAAPKPGPPAEGDPDSAAEGKQIDPISLSHDAPAESGMSGAVRAVPDGQEDRSDPMADQQDNGQEQVDLHWDVFLGESRPTPQFGLLAAVAAEPWRSVAFDLNGCNTVAVFGVQGGGKSYTLGSIIEMACREIPAINVLPRPLGAVVFHYHQHRTIPLSSCP